jgi:hypothetical protein
MVMFNKNAFKAHGLKFTILPIGDGTFVWQILDKKGLGCGIIAPSRDEAIRLFNENPQWVALMSE